MSTTACHEGFGPCPGEAYYVVVYKLIDHWHLGLFVIWAIKSIPCKGALNISHGCFLVACPSTINVPPIYNEQGSLMSTPPPVQ